MLKDENENVENVINRYLSEDAPLRSFGVPSHDIMSRSKKPVANDAPAAGIYDLPGSPESHECLIAYDYEGTYKLDQGVGAYGRLEDWLRGRGVKLPSSRPALFLI